MGVTRKKETQIYDYRKDFVSVDGRFPKTIVAKVDWFTAMFYDVSVEKVLDLYGLNHYMTDDIVKIYSERYAYETNLGKQIILQICPGIRMEIKCSLIESQLKIFNPMGMEFNELICEPLPAIRLDFSGSGLEFLRAGGYDVDRRFVQPSFVCAPDGTVFTQFDDVRFKITRIDIAFDLLNFEESFFNTCVALIHKYGDFNTGKMHLGEDPKCCVKQSYSIRQGRERTIYLGSPSSDKLCRIYDKGYQWNQARHKSIADHPYQTSDEILPESWIRIELQLRGSTKKCRCDELLHYAMGDYSKMFNYWYYHYAICSEKGRVCDEFAVYFDWSQIPTIIQNANYGNCSFTKEQRVRNSFHRVFSAALEIISYIGIDGFTNQLNEYWSWLQYSTDPSDVRKCSFIKQRCLNDDNSLPPFVEIVNGRWVLK